MSSIEFEVNEQIVGKANKVKDQLGIIKAITGDGKNESYQSSLRIISCEPWLSME